MQGQGLSLLFFENLKVLIVSIDGSIKMRRRKTSRKNNYECFPFVNLFFSYVVNEMFD